MAKIKPNEKCPCGSGNKYKRCCQLLKFQQQEAKADKFQQLLHDNESKEIMDPELSALNTYFLDRYRTLCTDITDIVDMSNLNMIHSEYRKKRRVLLLKRSDATEAIFKSKNAGQNDDVLVIWKNNFLAFNYEQELDEARKEIHKWRL